MAKRALLALLCWLPLAATAVEQYGYRVVERKPQDPANYVQGLEIVDGFLYVSSGGYGTSRLLRYHFEDVSLDIERQLDPRIFAEGLTVFGGEVYQLTWRNQVGLVYERDILKPKEMFRIPGEGWGMTNNGEELIYSDGSDRLYFLSPGTWTVNRSVAVTENGTPVTWLNELEWVDGKVWANVWKTDRILVIDPANGEVTASIDLTGLKPLVQAPQPDEVLNGIARNPADGAIWVTGKRWPWLYRIELVPKTGTGLPPTTPESR